MTNIKYSLQIPYFGKIRILTTLFFLCCVFNVLAQDSKFPDFECQQYFGKEQNLPYRLLLPINYDEKKTYPLVVFFHGAGERGTDNETTLTHIAPLFLKPENRTQYACFVLVPQCPTESKWVDTDWTLDSHIQPANPSGSLKSTIDLVELLQKKYSIDSKRLYVTGLSMGGFATWDLITRFPDKYAAAVPICGGADEAKAILIKTMPLRVFHGALDKLVKTSRSRNMVDALKKEGSNVIYTEYPQVGHGSWKPAYEEPDLLEWLFKQTK